MQELRNKSDQDLIKTCEIFPTEPEAYFDFDLSILKRDL
jgi:hypothetical protein